MSPQIKVGFVWPGYAKKETTNFAARKKQEKLNGK